MFEELTATIQEEIVRYLLRLQIEKPPEQGELEAAGGDQRRRPQLRARVRAGSDAIRAAGRQAQAAPQPAGGGHGRRRGRRGDHGLHGPASRLRRAAGRPQRPVLVRLGQEVQEVPRRLARRRAFPDVVAVPRALRVSGPHPARATFATR